MNATSDMAALDKWLRTVRGKRPPAVVMGSSSNGLCFCRSLGRRGISTLLLDSKLGLGGRSRYAQLWVLPAVDDHASEWLGFLESLASRVEQKPILFCTSDSHLLFLSRNRETIGEKYRFLIPDQATVENIVNKRIQYNIAQQSGIPIPKTVYPESVADVRSYAPDLSYPCILKPYSYRGRGAVGKKAILVESSRQLIESFSRVNQTGQPFMVQEIISGPRHALFAYHGIWDSDGREIGWWTKQHQRGILFGDGSYHITVDAPEVADLSRRLLTAFNYKGCSHVEFKLDSRDQTYRLMEINARTGMSSQQGITAGVDLPWLGYQYLSTGKVEDLGPTKFDRGVTYVHESFDINAYLSLRKTDGLSFLSWLRSFLTAKAKAIWAWDDPRPFLTFAGNLAKSGLRKAFTPLYASKKKIATAAEHAKKEQRRT